MKKTVRYTIGAAGAVPVLGLLAIPTATATTATQTPAHTAKKSVRADRHTREVVHPDTCTGTHRHTLNQGHMHLTFYSKPVGSARTCIGTIIFSYNGPNPASRAGAQVETANPGDFCARSVGGTFISDGCHEVFINSGLAVLGSESRGGPVPVTIYDPYPFTSAKKR